MTQDVRWVERGRAAGRAHNSSASHVTQQPSYRGQQAASIYSRHTAVAIVPTAPPLPAVSSLSASAAPFVIKASAPLPPSQQVTHDLASLHAAYIRSPSSASALLLTAPPSAESLLSLLDELLSDMQSTVSRYHSPMHVRLLSVLLAWLTRTLTELRAAAGAVDKTATDVTLLNERHASHLCYLMQAMSAHRIAEIRLAVAQCVLAFVKTVSSLASATPITASSQSSAAPLAASLCVLSTHQLDVLSALGQLAVERAMDDDSAIRAVYRQVIGWSGVRISLLRRNPGREWKSAQEREQSRVRQAESHEQRRQRDEPHRKEPLSRTSDGEHKRFDTPDSERIVESEDGASAPSASDGDASEEPSSSESEDEHGHVSLGEEKSSDDEEHSPLKADLVRRVLNTKVDKQRRTARDDKLQRKTQAASSGDEASIAASPGLTGANEADEAEEGEMEAADEQSSASSNSSSRQPSVGATSTVAATSSALLPVPPVLSSSAAHSPQTILLSSSLSSGYRSRQFELTVSTFLTSPEPISSELTNDSYRRSKGERKEERKDNKRDAEDGTSKREWIQFALYLLYPSDSDSRPHSPLAHGMQSLISSSAALQSAYALTSACKWLLHSALKSPFGREVATLSYIDRLLSDLLRARNTRAKDASTARPEPDRLRGTDESHAGAVDSSVSVLSSMASSSTYSRLLHFFFLFDKYVHLAISPSLSSFATSSSPTSSLFYRLERLTPLFFQQNSQSCLTFFVRSYPKLLSLAVSLDDQHSVISIARDIHRLSLQQLSGFVSTEGEELLYEEMDAISRAQLKDWMKALTALSYGYLQRGEVEQLEVLRDWARGHLIAVPTALFTQPSDSDPSTEAAESSDGPKVQVVSAVELCPAVEGMCWQAQSMYREALSCYIGLLHSSHKQSAPSLLSNTGRRVLRRCIRDCFFGLRDWVGQLAWLRQSASSASSDDFTLWLGWEQVDERLRKGRQLDSNAQTALKLHSGKHDSSSDQLVGGSVLAESEEKAELIDKCALSGYISLLSPPPHDTPTADPNVLQSLKSWDIASTLLLDDLLHSSASFSPPAAMAYLSPPSLSSLLSLSCFAALSRRSLTVLHPFISSFADPIFASQLRLVDCMKALTAVQAVASVTAPSAASTGTSLSVVSTQHVSRSFVLSVAHQCVQRGELVLLDTVLQMEAALPFPSTVMHRAELSWLRALQCSHRNDLTQALSLQWEVVDRLLVGQREKLVPPTSEYTFIPISLQASTPAIAATHPPVGEVLPALRAAHLLHLQRLVDATFVSDDAKHNAILARLLLSKFHTLDAQAGAVYGSRAMASGFLRTWLQSYSLSTAARLAPLNSEVWARYGEWCDAELKRKLQPARADAVTTDADWRAIHALASSYQSLSTELMGASVTDGLYRCMTSAVDNSLHRRAGGDPSAASIAALLMPLLSSLYFDEETGDSIDLPPALVQAICAIAEKRQALLVSLSRTSLASLVSSVLVSARSASASFAHTVDVPLRLLTTVLESPLDHCDILSSALLSLPPSTFLFIVPQLFAALSHALSAPTAAAASYTVAFVRALLVRVGEEWPDAVLFGLLARLSEQNGGNSYAVWRGLAVDIDHRLASQLIQRVRESQKLSTTVQPTHVTARAAWVSLFSAADFSSSPTAFGPFAAVDDEPSLSPTPPSLSSISVSFRSLLAEAERLSSQLSRVGHLPEDTLLSAIRVLQADLPNRVKLLMDEMEEEREEAEANDWERDKRRIERFQLIVSPLVAQVEAVQQSLLATGSPQEQQFRRRWQRHLSNLRSLLSASSLAVPLSEPLVFGQRVAEALNALKRAAGRMHVLSMANVSPALAAWQDSHIRLPGLRAGDNQSSHMLPLTAMWRQLASIASFAPSFTVIRTKTRPKRLHILSSDGVSYPFLLKSREDLHVDARMMQTVDAVNMGLAQQRQQCAGKQCSRGDRVTAWADHHCTRHDLYAPTYPVTPLSSSLGILRWIEHATPIFDLHRTKRRKDKDRHRDRATDSDRGNKDRDRETRELKGNELFMSKMLSALAQTGLSSRMPRRDWPLALLRQVYGELVRDVPADMVASYLSFVGCSAADVLRLQSAFVSSLAAMSMCGYVFGVGDRHLGNMLLDSSGRVVHIDYNVSLDRGRRLPVPEIVPFRLTRVLRYVCGDEGEGDGSMRLFRVLCRGVLGWLREHQQPLLALLQSFVHSPIADWQTDTAKRANKGVLAGTKLSETADIAIAITLLTARLRRRQGRLDHTYSLFLQALQPVDNAFRRLALLDEVLQRAERGERLSEQAAMLSELLFADMDALQRSQQQLEQMLRQQQRRAMTQHTAALQDELTGLQAECQLLASRYATAADIRQALTSRSLHFLPQLRELYRQELLDWLVRYCPSFGPLLQQHAADLRALRPLLSVLAKSVSSGCRAMADWTRQGMDSLQRSVVSLASGGGREAWEAGCSVQDSRYTDMREMVAALKKAFAALPGRLEEERRRLQQQQAEEAAGNRVEEAADGLERQTSTAADQFAIDGLRRVKEKLDGVEASAGGVSERARVSGTLSVEEHVDWLIGEATSVDNLCRMYEGWAPWI